MSQADLSFESAAVIEVSGHNPVEFLQGYLTVDTTKVSTDRFVPMAITNLKGRVVANGWIKQSKENSLLLLVHSSLGQRVCDFLAPYARFARAQLTIMESTPHLSEPESDPDFNRWRLDFKPPAAAEDGTPAVLRVLVDERYAWMTGTVPT